MLYLVLERTRLGALVRAGVDDRATAETLGIDIAKVFALVFGIGTYLAGVAGVVAAPIFGIYPGMDVSIIILVLIVVVVGGLGSLRGAILGSAADRICRHLRQVLLPQFAMMMIYLVMALALIFRPSGLMPARRFHGAGLNHGEPRLSPSLDRRRARRSPRSPARGSPASSHRN